GDTSPSPRLALRRITTSSSSTESAPSGLHLKTDEPTSKIIAGGSVMGAVEAALNTAQILATAALQAENEEKESEEEDRLSVFLDSLPADGSKESGGDGSRPDTPVSSSSDGDGGDASKVKEGATNGKKTHWKSQSVGEVVDVRHTGGSEEESAENVNFSQNRELWQRRAASQTQIESSKSIVKNFRSNQEFWEMRQKHTPDLVMDLPLLGSSSPKEAGGGKKSLSAVSLSSLSSSSSSGEEENSATETVVSPSGPESPDMTTAAERFAKQNQCTLKKNTKASHGVSIDAQTQTIKAATKRSKFAASSAIAAQETISNNDSPADVIKTSNDEKSSGDVKSQSTESELVPIRSPGPQRTTQKIGGKFGPSGPLLQPLPLQVGAVSSFKPQVKVKPQILRKPVLPVPHPHHTQPSPELLRKEKAQD
ncbi:hypothetical protein C0J52_21038, partial [Blattella germanica]